MLFQRSDQLPIRHWRRGDDPSNSRLAIFSWGNRGPLAAQPEQWSQVRRAIIYLHNFFNLVVEGASRATRWRRDRVYRQSWTARPRVSLTSALSSEANDAAVTSPELGRSVA